MEGEKSGLKIWMLIEHRDQEMSHSMYLIEPPLVEEEMDSDGFAVDSISPIKTIEEKQGDCCIISECGMFRVGSRFYNLGGRSIYDWYMCKWKPPLISNELKLRVQFFDIDHPELGFQRAASLNAPKEAPCVFSVCGRIYALGSRVRDCNLGGGHKGRGIFERYDPDEDCWTVLPDPPKPFGEAAEILWCDSATVVRDRYIYVGNTAHQLYLVFDLEDEQWAYLPHSSSLFPYGSLYVDDSLYYLTGIGSWKPGTQFDDDTLNYYAADDDNKVRLVKRGPLPLVDDPVKFINSMPVDEHVMSTFTQLEGDTWFTEIDYMQWRDIFHLGGRFFCYVVTAHLTNDINPLLPSQLYCRGVWIKVFEEVLPNSNSTTKLPHFRTLASFSYRIRTPFINNGYLIRCSAFGSVPDSWVKAPLKKNQVAAKGREALKAEQSQHEYGGGSEGQRDNSLDKLLAARDEEYSRLKAELAEKDKLLREKDKLLKDYESFLAKNKGKSVLIGE